MNIQRLQSLINIMTRVRDYNVGFDIRNWSDWESTGKDGKMQSQGAYNDCGTTACVAGWLAVSPEFKALGGNVSVKGCPYIRLTRTKRHNVYGPEAVAIFLETDMETIDDQVLYMGRSVVDVICGCTSYDIVMRFYGLDPITSHLADITAEMVVNRLIVLKQELIERTYQNG